MPGGFLAVANGWTKTTIIKLPNEVHLIAYIKGTKSGCFGVHEGEPLIKKKILCVVQVSSASYAPSGKNTDTTGMYASKGNMHDEKYLLEFSPRL